MFTLVWQTLSWLSINKSYVHQDIMHLFLNLAPFQLLPPHYQTWATAATFHAWIHTATTHMAPDGTCNDTIQQNTLKLGSPAIFLSVKVISAGTTIMSSMSEQHISCTTATAQRENLATSPSKEYKTGRFARKDIDPTHAQSKIARRTTQPRSHSINTWGLPIQAAASPAPTLNLHQSWSLLSHRRSICSTRKQNCLFQMVRNGGVFWRENRVVTLIAANIVLSTEYKIPVVYKESHPPGALWRAQPGRGDEDWLYGSRRVLLAGL